MATLKKNTSNRRNHRPRRSLSHGRPSIASSKARNTARTTSTSTAPLPSRQTRRLIRSHHTLHKRLAAAQAANDTSLAESLQARIDAAGGLAAYQAASVTGADKRRGGDTSKKLLEFLDRAGAAGSNDGSNNTSESGNGSESQAQCRTNKTKKKEYKLKMLDVGAVSSDTAASRSVLFSEIERIDLRSREKGVIMEQDFMQRPLPATDNERFDVLCLSLVVNYVPDAKGRGEMLKRVCEFLRLRRHGGGGQEEGGYGSVLPALFLVLPAPCIANSRYLDQGLLTAIMESLGFSLVEQKVSAKLAYSLWTWHGPVKGVPNKRQKFPKTEVNPGKSRNNFAIVVD